MSIWEEILELNRSVTNLSERLNETNERLADAERRIDNLTEHSNELYNLTDALYLRIRYHLKDLLELQTALVTYLNRHPAKYKDLREIVNPIIETVEAHLQDRAKLMELVETGNIAGVTQLTESDNIAGPRQLDIYAFDWTFSQLIERWKKARIDKNARLIWEMNKALRNS